MNFKEKCKRFFTLSRSAEGFTLVELIVVIAILGILSGIGIPMYSKYIEKANIAVDNQNLAMLHNMFVVSCVENSVDPAVVTVVDIEFDGTTFSRINEVTVASAAYYGRRSGGSGVDKATDIKDTFNGYMNGDVRFKSKEITENDIIDGIHNGVEDSGAKISIELTDSQGNKFTLSIPAEDIANFAASTLYKKLGAAGLTSKIDFVTGFAADLMSDPNSTISSYIMSDSQKLAIAKQFGYDSFEELKNNSEYQTIFGTLYEKLYADTKYDGLTDQEREDAAWADAEKQLMANYAVVTSSQTAKNMDADSFLTVLKNQDAKGMIKQGDASAVMTNAALAYAMYTSYTQSEYVTENAADTNNPDAIMDALNDPGFQNYLNDPQAKKDLDGYLSALSMASTVVQGSEQTLQDVLSNGYANDNVNTMIGQIMGSNQTGE